MRPACITPLLALLGCASARGESEAQVPVDLQPCHVKGVDVETLCGAVQVYEDRAAASGRTIDLNVLVFPAVSPDPLPDPLFFLAGGPGQAATEVAASVAPIFQRVQKRRDIVFVDQRGTGKSNRLDCEPDSDDEDGEGDATGGLADLFAPVADAGDPGDCLDALDADTRLYTTPVAMDDLDEVRARLGYERINVYGGSYGTRAGLVYMRRHPERLRAAILDGLAPTTMELFLHFAPDGQAAYDALVRDCAAAPACAEAFPDLDGLLPAMLEELAESPAEARLRHPRSGDWVDLTVGPEALAMNLRNMLYAPYFTGLVPLAMTEAREGDWGPFTAIAQAMSDSTGEGLAVGMMLSVVCAEDIPRITPEARERAAEGTFLGDALVSAMVEACAEWPVGELPAGYNDAVVSDTPTLLLSGALDPVTPPRWGDAVGATLSESAHGVAPGAGHNVAPLGCAPRVMAEFLDAGSVDELDLSCIGEVTRPAFFIDFAGPSQ